MYVYTIYYIFVSVRIDRFHTHTSFSKHLQPAGQPAAPSRTPGGTKVNEVNCTAWSLVPPVVLHTPSVPEASVEGTSVEAAQFTATPVQARSLKVLL